MRRLHILAILAAGALLAACQGHRQADSRDSAQAAFGRPDDPTGADGYAPIKRYESMQVPADNPITAAKAALGRQLYYDYRLSGDGSRSCYHCHLVQHGLTDGLPTSVGAFDMELTRGSPTMRNIGYHAEFYWDGHEADRGAFKAPTLRDIARSAPYFHDGSAATLPEAVRLMARGGIANPYLDAGLKPYPLSAAQLADLLEFLASLSQDSDLGEPPVLPE